MISPCNTTTDLHNRELLRHGSTAFPIACYHDDLARETVPWHWHDELEAAIVTEGRIHVVIGGEQFDADTGEGFFVNAGALHSCHRINAGGCRLHSLVFHPRLVGGGAESVFYQKYVTPVTENPGFGGMRLQKGEPWQADVLAELETVWQACAGEPEQYELNVRHGLSSVMARMCGHVSAPRAAASAKALRNGERIKAMLQFIEAHFGDEIDTAAIARSAAISESECLRCFKATIGTTPIRYLRQYRVEQAAAQLAAEGGSIADVAALCGFQDVSYFTKTFRELKGMTPGEYQRQCKTNEL